MSKSLGLGFCLSFSVYPLGASAFDRISTKGHASPSVQSPACLQQEAESPPVTPHTRGCLPLPAPHPATAPIPPIPQWPLRKDMLPGQGLQQPLHFGLEFHNGLTGTRVFLWSGQEVGKEKGESERWRGRGTRRAHSPGPGLGNLGEVWGACEN